MMATVVGWMFRKKARLAVRKKHVADKATTKGPDKRKERAADNATTKGPDKRKERAEDKAGSKTCHDVRMEDTRAMRQVCCSTSRGTAQQRDVH